MAVTVRARQPVRIRFKTPKCFIISSTILHAATIAPLIHFIFEFETLKLSLDASQLSATATTTSDHKKDTSWLEAWLDSTVNVSDINWWLDELDWRIRLLYNKTVCTRGYTFCDVTSTCIKINLQQPINWYESKQICEFEGGQLVTFSNEKEDVSGLLDWIDIQHKTMRDGLSTSVWLGGKFIEGNWTWLGQSPSLIDVKKWGLTETPEKEEYCLLAKCYDTIDSGMPSCLHGVNCTANVYWSQQGGSEIGYICEQEAYLPEHEFWWPEP